MIEFKVRVRGIDQHIRSLAKTNDNTRRAAKEGVNECAEFLIMMIKAKFGKYQSTGGDGGGAWKKLKTDTVFRKLKRYGLNNKPLIASSEMMNSFSVVKGGKGTLSASVGSDSPYIIHHVYGAPRANVPRRDPVTTTVDENVDKCQELLLDMIEEALEEEW